jgi:putative transposase
MFKREGWSGGRNLAYRLYREEGLCCAGCGRAAARRRKIAPRATAPRGLNDASNLDFVHDQLTNGQGFRALNIIDVYSREALAIEVGPLGCAASMWWRCSSLVQQRGVPRYLFAGNGSNLPAS